MIESFKTGKKLPKRVVWEIILGVKAIVDKERSMVERTVDEGVVCDVVGDTHGVSQIGPAYSGPCGDTVMAVDIEADNLSNSLTSSTCWKRSGYPQRST